MQIGDHAGLCAGDAVSVSKTEETAVLVSTNTLSGDYIYTFDIDFNITVDNIGSTSITIKEYIPNSEGINNLVNKGIVIKAATAGNKWAKK